MKTPDAFVAAKASKQSNKRAIDIARWWQALNDPELNSLVERAIRENPDAQIALTRLQKARTQEAVVMGVSLPQVEISGGAARGTGSNLARGRATGPLVAATNTQGLEHITQVVGFDAGWEIDLFGKYQRKLEAARYDREAAVAIRNNVLISVVANVARAYVDMRGLQMQLAVLRRNIETAKQYENVVRQRFEHGITNELDLTLVQRQISTMEAKVAPLASQITAAHYVIAVLTGQFPEDSSKELEKPAMIPQLPEQIQPGVPLDLLRRRPDIHEAERQLAGATARVGVATANLFPRIILTAGAGHQGQGLGITPTANSFIWSAGPTVGWPILDFGALDAMVNIADLHTQELLVNYKKTVMTAVQEVDTAVSAYTGQQERLRNLNQALTTGQRAVSLALERYDRGLTDSLNVIDAQRHEYDLEEQYVAAQKTAAEQFITLYKALGGGWEQYQTVPPIRQAKPAVLAAFDRLLVKDAKQ
jgi:NodT family efflux transporter outer membrane factor (OMF) lipoprotein